MKEEPNQRQEPMLFFDTVPAVQVPRQSIARLTLVR
jgi:hypothetical protein